MPTDLSNATELIERLLKLLSIVAIAYIIVMGLIQRAGVKYGVRTAQRRREREGKPKVISLPRSDNSAAFWKDETLLRAGLQAIAGILILCSFVILMLIFNPPRVQELPGAVSRLMTYPNFMAAVVVFQLTLALFSAHNSRPFLWLLVVLSIACAVLTWLVGSWPEGRALGFQGIIFLTQSSLLAYIVGVHIGVRAADVEKELPLAEVHTLEGDIVKDLRMQSASQTEYRFIGKDGAECLMPATQVRMIRVVRDLESVKKVDQKSKRLKRVRELIGGKKGK